MIQTANVTFKMVLRIKYNTSKELNFNFLYTNSYLIVALTPSLVKYYLKL